MDLMLEHTVFDLDYKNNFILQTFRRLLISKLQDEFENRAKNVERKWITFGTCDRLQNMFVWPGLNFFFFLVVFERNDSPLTSDEEEQRAIAKIKMLGNIKFIGELGKLNLIHESILHKCIKTVSLLVNIYVVGQNSEPYLLIFAILKSD